MLPVLLSSALGLLTTSPAHCLPFFLLSLLCSSSFSLLFYFPFTFSNPNTGTWWAGQILAEKCKVLPGLRVWEMGIVIVNHGFPRFLSNLLSLVLFEPETCSPTDSAYRSTFMWNSTKESNSILRQGKKERGNYDVFSFCHVLDYLSICLITSHENCHFLFQFCRSEKLIICPESYS